MVFPHELIRRSDIEVTAPTIFFVSGSLRTLEDGAKVTLDIEVASATVFSISVSGGLISTLEESCEILAPFSGRSGVDITLDKEVATTTFFFVGIGSGLAIALEESGKILAPFRSRSSIDVTLEESGEILAPLRSRGRVDIALDIKVAAATIFGINIARLDCRVQKTLAEGLL